MSTQSYLQWLVEETPTSWWHDSGDPTELQAALVHGASGVTTNPVLGAQALASHPQDWADLLSVGATDTSSEDRAEYLMGGVARRAAATLANAYQQTSGREGYACAQVDPGRAADVDAMLQMAERFHACAPNIAVKLPATAAGLDVLEECAARGITVTATVSFTVPQVLQIAERYQNGLARLDAGQQPGRCFAVIMIGRIDDYLADVAKDRKVDVSDADIRQAGLAITKRAYGIYQEREYQAVLLVAALRGTYHLTELAGGNLVMSVHPKYQQVFFDSPLPREQRIDSPIDSQAIERLKQIPEFIRAYEPDGMQPEEFFTYGVTQRTLSQFQEVGWLRLKQM